MLFEEACWFHDRIAELADAELFPMLNVGSGTDVFRSKSQPWIQERIFAPIERRRGRVAHMDIQDRSGVDLVGDLTSDAFLSELAAMEFRSVVCSNLLEHVANPHLVCEAIVSAVVDDGYVLASCPYRYPFHPSPIDTRFRPSVTELAEQFDGTRIVAGAVVIGETFLDTLKREPKHLVRVLMPFYKPRNWLGVAHKYAWMFSHFQASCVLVQKHRGGLSP